MKKLFLPLIILLFFSSASAFQSGNDIKRIDGKDYRVYTVQKGDTWYAIARKFEISYAELRVSNKDADDKLAIGKELLIPAKLKPNDPYFEKNYTEVKTTATVEDKFHIVQQSQTLFSISKLHGVTVDQVKAWNNLSSNSIGVGQKLIVGKKTIDVPATTSVTPEPKPVVTEEVVASPQKEIKVESTEPIVVSAPVPETDSIMMDTTLVTSGVEDIISTPETEVKIEQPRIPDTSEIDASKGDEVVFSNGRIQINETGTAVWIDESDVYADKYYALHRTAKIGTVIRVMNLSNSRKIYVKVTGQLPDDSENDGILIKLSKASADKLGIVENSARVNLLYGSGEE